MWGLGTLPDGNFINLFTLFFWVYNLWNIQQIENWPESVWINNLTFNIFLFHSHIYFVPGFPAAAYAAYAAGQSYSRYPSFGLPYPTGNISHAIYYLMCVRVFFLDHSHQEHIYIVSILEFCVLALLNENFDYNPISRYVHLLCTIQTPPIHSFNSFSHSHRIRKSSLTHVRYPHIHPI